MHLPTALSTHDGVTLQLQDWGGSGTRGLVLLVHGLGEHVDRYGHVADFLSKLGFRVVGYDQRGHGRSSGHRGVIPSPDALLRDLELVVDTLRPHTHRLVLLGHSMGGAVAAQFVAEGRRPVDALVLSSPALAADLGVVQRLQLGIGERFLPDLAQGNGLDPHRISHDSAVVRAYIEDPLVHDRISARLARSILVAGETARAAAATWRVPTLLLYAGDDHLVSAKGSDAFAASAPSEVVEAHRFDALYHEILNEGALAAPVFTRLGQWLEARCPM